jgi:hypothetical protein
MQQQQWLLTSLQSTLSCTIPVVTLDKGNHLSGLHATVAVSSHMNTSFCTRHLTSLQSTLSCTLLLFTKKQQWFKPRNSTCSPSHACIISVLLAPHLLAEHLELHAPGLRVHQQDAMAGALAIGSHWNSDRVTAGL